MGAEKSCGGAADPVAARPGCGVAGKVGWGLAAVDARGMGVLEGVWRGGGAGVGVGWGWGGVAAECCAGVMIGE